MYDEVLETVIKILIIPTIPLLALWIRAWVIAQVNNLKGEMAKRDLEKFHEYLDVIEGMVMSIVYSVKQTYVNELKENDAWTIERQKEAFSIVKGKVLDQLSDTGKKLLEKGMNDYESYIEDLIESYVNSIEE